MLSADQEIREKDEVKAELKRVTHRKQGARYDLRWEKRAEVKGFVRHRGFRLIKSKRLS